MALREWLRRAAVLASLLAAAGCPNRNENESALRAGSGSVASVGASPPPEAAAPRQQDASVSSASLTAEPVFALDAIGLSIRDQRVDLDSPDAERKLNGIAQEASAGHGTIRVSAARDSRLRWIRSLVRAFGASGAPAVRVTTPAGTPGATETLAISPLGQVPAHEDHCGVRATVSTTHAVELQSGKKKIKILPTQERGDSEMAKALTDTRDRMKECASTVWMLTGEQNATWGDAFDIGVAVVQAHTSATTYVMVL